jgi:peptidylprolyl isomerase
MRRLPRLALLLAALASTLALAACGGDDDTGSAGSGAVSAGTATATAAASSPTDTSAKPALPALPAKPPTELVRKDIVEGTGAVAKRGDTLTMQYAGWSFSNRKQFDASWDRGEPFTFTLGAGDVIKGWDLGIAGMRVGGRRELIIPPYIGYGTAGSAPAIKPNETLIFIVDLQKAEPAS